MSFDRLMAHKLFPEFKEPKEDRIVDWGDEEERRFYLAKEYCGELEV